jgi:hypothetical protein
MIARNGGYFSSLKPAGDVPLLSKALRQRKTTSSAEVERSKDVKGKGKAKEEVVLEKSNVLMMYVYPVFSIPIPFLFHLDGITEPPSLVVAFKAIGLLGWLLSSLDGLRPFLSNFPPLVSRLSLLLIFSGPTGTGKTLMAKTLAKILDVPFA